MIRFFSKIYPLFLWLIVLVLFLRGTTDLLAQWHSVKASQSVVRGDFDSAEKQYLASLTLNPNPDYCHQLANIFYIQKLNDRALFFIQKAIALNPEKSTYYYLRAKIYWAEQKIDLVENDFKKAIQLDKFNHLEYYTDLAKIYLENKDYQATDDLISGILAYYPDEVITYLKEREKEAASQLRVSEDQIDLGYLSKISQLYFLRGIISSERGQSEQAEIFFKKATEIKSFQPNDK